MEPVTLPMIDLIREAFEYNPEMGRLIRNGNVLDPEYNVSFCGKIYDYATLCWVVYYGRFPKIGHIIDHRDQVKINHRIGNLREATLTQNQQNKAGHGAYAKGVTWRDRKSKPWQAKIRVNGKRLHLGSFATETEAAQAYREAAIKYHGEFACYD